MSDEDMRTGVLWIYSGVIYNPIIYIYTCLGLTKETDSFDQGLELAYNGAFEPLLTTVIIEFL